MIAATICCSLLLAQPSNEPQYLEIREFVGLEQDKPAHLSLPGSAGFGKNFNNDADGALVRSATSSCLSTPTTFGTLSNCTAFGDTDPGKTDTDRVVFMGIDCSAPTNGVAGQHILAASLEDDGDTNGIVIASATAWHQVDDKDELSLTAEKFDGFTQVVKGYYLAYMATTQGVIEIAGEQGSASASTPVTCAWLGSPSRPSCEATSGTGNVDGTYQYKVSYVTGLGETMPSKPSAPITTATGKITIDLPIGPSATTARKIYRTKGGGVTLDNPSFESWSSTVPTSWTTSGAGATFTTGIDSETLIEGFESTTGWSHPYTSPYAYADASVKTQGSYSIRQAGTGIIVMMPHNSASEGIGKTVSVANPGYDYFKIDIYLTPSYANQSAYAYVYHPYGGGGTSHFAFCSSAGWNEVTLTGPVNDTTINYIGIRASQDPWDGAWHTSSDGPRYDNLRGYVDGKYAGTYALKVTRSGADAQAYQVFDGTTLAGANATFTAWIKTATASIARIGIYDDGDTTTEWSTEHDGDNTWQQLTATKTMNAGAGAGCRVVCEVNDTNGFAYFDAAEIGGGAGGNDGYFYLATVGDNTTTTYVDNIADTSLSVAEDVSARYAVPTAQWLAFHNDRMWSIGKTQATTQRQLLWYSDDGDLEHWPVDNWIAVGDESDVATGLASHYENLYVLKRKSIWRLSGYDNNDFALRRVVGSVGCEDGRTIQVSDDGIYFYGSGSIWVFDGSALRNIGVNLERGFLEDVYIDSSAVTWQANSCFAKDRYYLGYKQGGSGSYALYVLDFNRKTTLWGRTQMFGLPSMWHYPATMSDKVLAVGYDGRIWSIEQGGHDDAASQELMWYTHALDFGDRLVDKRVDAIFLSVDSTWASTGTVYTVDLYRNVSEQQVRAGQVGTAHLTKTFAISDGLNNLEWRLGSESSTNVFRTMCIRVSESGEADASAELTEQPPRLLGMYIQYRPFRRRP